MAREIERKFLLATEAWRAGAGTPVRMIQGYFATDHAVTPTIRVRIAGERAFLTVKGRPAGIVRSEFEYPLPIADAEAMLREFCGERIVEKQRFTFPAGSGLYWEVDEYFGNNSGLFTAEIELTSPEQAFDRPAWLGREVTGEGRYSNGALSRNPFRNWQK